MKVRVPTDPSQIPLEAFQKLSLLEEPNPIDLVSILCEIPKAKVRAFKARSVDEIASVLSKAFEKKYNLTRTFKMDGVEYGFIPNLDDASYGEIDDIREYISDVQKWHLAMGVMYRPIKGRVVRGKYMIEDYVPGQYSEKMKRAPMSVALGAQVFFWTLTIDLLSCIPSYMKAEESLNINGSERSGEDTTVFLRSLEETLPVLTKLREQMFTGV